MPKPKKFDDEYHRIANEKAKEYYYKHRKERNKYSREYHKRIKDYSIKHNITFEEALKKVGKQKRR